MRKSGGYEWNWCCHRWGNRLIYDLTTGSLFYDADGTGAASQQQLAQLADSPALSAFDVVIVA